MSYIQIYRWSNYIDKENFEKNVQLSWNSQKIQNFIFHTKLKTTKRDNLNFNIIKMLYQSSNIPRKMLYSAISAEILLIWKTIIMQFIITIQFIIFNVWKVPRNWIGFSQNSFVISPSLLYHLVRRDRGRFANEAFTSNLIVSLKQ